MTGILFLNKTLRTTKTIQESGFWNVEGIEIWDNSITEEE